MPRLLLVEDDEALAIALRDGFGFEGYEVTLAHDGEQALRLATGEPWDVMILDVMLPRLSGLDVCRRLRRDGVKLPIIILTARGQEIDKVVGLKTGADDYVTKPFSFLELLARVEAVLRRTRAPLAPLECFEFGEIRVDFERREVQSGKTPVELSHLEFDLLAHLIRNRGKVLPREELLEAVWGYGSDAQTRTVDVHVARLRKKLEARPSDPAFILTVHRVGYKFRA
jgi:two-component system alkaline phosphatase synthesis response regulator PhoP